MISQIVSLVERLEDPQNPLLGPNLKGLYVIGLWQTGCKLRNRCYNFVHFSLFLFVISQVIELWIKRHDYAETLNNLSDSPLALVCLFKVLTCVLWQSNWRELVEAIAAEEISQKQKQNNVCAKIMKSYTTYARIVTYLYCNVIMLTGISMLIVPFLKPATNPEYREKISNGTEPLPQIFKAWFPFDKTQMPGYPIAILTHALINIYGGGAVSLYDSIAVVVMVFIKGQLAILREYCKRLFEGDGKVDGIIVLNRIKECHRLHNFIVKQNALFNSLLSPVMFLYVLMCSGMICCNVVQFTAADATTAQKLLVLQYTIAVISQLFLYCWHGNEVLVESLGVSRGVYESEWWRADVRTRRHVALLGGKLTHTLTYRAGPFVTLCVPTFIEIIKTSYSFFTLLSQMQEE